MTTTLAKPAESERAWYIIDARDQVLGRLASRIADVLRGKHKPTFSPHQDLGDFVIVVNADKVRLTGRKLDTKRYYRYSGYPGGMRSSTAGELLNKHPERVLMFAVRGMLPKNRLARRVVGKLKIYSGAEHPHAAQQPQPLTLS